MPQNQQPASISIAIAAGSKSKLAQDILPFAAVRDFTGTAAPGDAVLVDGHDDPRRILERPDALRAILDAGATLAVANPDATQLAAIRRVAGGAGPSIATDLVVVTRRAGTDASYKVTAMPRPTGAALTVASNAGWTQSRLPALPQRIGAALASVVPEHRAASLAAAVAADVGGLVPPPQSPAGQTATNWPAQQSLGAPTINGQLDDSTASGSQQLSLNLSNQYYVYCAGGDLDPQGHNRPYYYIVILKQTGSATTGGALANNNNSRGWYLAGAMLEGTHVSCPGGVAVTPQSYTPLSDGGQAEVSVSQPMTLMVGPPGSSNPTAFTAQEDTVIPLPGWAVSNVSNPGQNYGCRYHQTTPWDPIVNDPSNFGGWWGQAYDGSGNVIPLTSLSLGTANYETLSAWRFDATDPTNNPLEKMGSILVYFSGNQGALSAFMHNPSGCLGARGSTHHDLFALYYYWNWGDTIDLVQLAPPPTATTAGRA